MQPGRPSHPLPLSPEERAKLEHWAAGRDRRLARRASIVLGFADGEEPKILARRFRLSEPTAVKWRTRFDASRLAGLVDAARSGAPRRILTEDVEGVIARLREPPPPGQSRWTTRTLARACGVSQTTVSRIWRAHGIDPRAPTFPATPDAGREEAEDSRPAASAIPDPTEAYGAELSRLTGEIADLRQIAPLDLLPFLRVALEALEAALPNASTLRMRTAREGAHMIRLRTQAAVAQARVLVKEARSRIEELHAIGRRMDMSRPKPERDG